MKYTKEYCKENKIAIHVIEISQLKKVEELFDRDYSEFGCNITYLKYSNQYLVPYGNVYGDVYEEGKNYTIITFEELMQDLNQNSRKRQFKHKITGKICTLIEGTNLYQVQGGDKLAEWLLRDSLDWEEIKPEFKVGDIVHIVKADVCSTKHNYFGEIIRLKAHNIYSILVKTNRDITGYSEIYCSEVRLATEEEILEYNKPKVGDWAVCLTYRHNDFKDPFIVDKIEGKFLYHKSGCNRYSHDFRKATPEEIQAYKESQELRIGEHKLEIIQDGNFTNKAKFGCQEFSLEELETIKRLFDSNIQAKVNILGVDITGEFIDKIIAKL